MSRTTIAYLIVGLAILGSISIAFGYMTGGMPEKIDSDKYSVESVLTVNESLCDLTLRSEEVLATERDSCQSRGAAKSDFHWDSEKCTCIDDFGTMVFADPDNDGTRQMVEMSAAVSNRHISKEQFLELIGNLTAKQLAIAEEIKGRPIDPKTVWEERMQGTAKPKQPANWCSKHQKVHRSGKVHE